MHLFLLSYVQNFSFFKVYNACFLVIDSLLSYYIAYIISLLVIVPARFFILNIFTFKTREKTKENIVRLKIYCKTDTFKWEFIVNELKNIY